MKAASGHGPTPPSGMQFHLTPREAVCFQNARGYVQVNIPQYYVETPVKLSAKSICVARTVPRVFGYDRDRRGRL